MPGKVIDWNDVETRTVIPGFHGRFVHSDRMTFALWQLDEGALLPEHSHPHEQVVHVYEGAVEMTIDGKTQVIRAGQVGIIPGNAVHSGRVLAPSRVMDVFEPIREDYMQGARTGFLQAAAGGDR